AKPITYRLEFVDSANVITGFSITDLNGPHQTKTEIKGTINVKKKQVYFRETRILDTKSKEPVDSMCYVTATLSIKEKGKTRILTGKFKGIRKDRRIICGEGSALLFSKEDVL